MQAQARGVEEMRDAMYNGHNINFTMGQPVLHIALRNRTNVPVYVNGDDVIIYKPLV